MNSNQPSPKQGLYDPQFEHDACGVGFIAHLQGQQSHSIGYLQPIRSQLAGLPPILPETEPLFS